MFKHLSDLGQGGFGRVDLVEDAVGQRFARKSFSFVSADTGIRENVQRRFVKEVRVQQGFSHSNIVPILGHDLSHDPPYYLMPVAQSSLDRDLAADPRLGGEWIAALTDIVEGLDELHSLSIFHRDLKPQNVLRFDGPKVKTYAISDFGLVSQKESSLSTLTVTGMKKGSDFYTAPEIASDFRKSSSRSDIYSLGCIIHDMVGEEARVPCHEIREGGPYAGVLLGCTRLKPEQRFASARAVLDAVRSIDEVASLTFSVDATIYVNALASADGLPFDFYAEVADFLESHVADRAAICLSLSLQRVQELCSYGEDVASRIAPIFAEWAAKTAHPFESCDGIALRLEWFFGSARLDVRVECLLALLEMGVDHNRWFAERMFVRLCGPAMDDILARRLAIEFRVHQEQVCRQIAHLEGSIGQTRAELHPRLVAVLGELCL